jgi:predicted ATPase/class 3 adenylate cyclase
MIDAAMRDDLPTGSVTFLFTDIEGSTRLLHDLGAERYARSLAEHRRMLREAFGAHGGVEVDTQGDAFFVAFANARAALAAARQAQQALSADPIHVRMGVHTGRPLLTDEGYVGVDVHKAARICSAGHGGQILVSEQTKIAAGHGDLRSLGLHRLKDLTAPEPLYQVGEAEFPPLKSLNQSNLPEQPTPFAGRERELAEVLHMLRRGDVRLLTLTGPGGSGKTRLAVQAAAEMVEEQEHGVWWVGLQAVRDPGLVVPTIASTIGAAGDLAAHVARRRMLFLLDNLEQVVDAAPDLGRLLAACPNLTLLATSRETLRLAAEHEYAVPPLAEPEALDLFLARARAVRTDFSGNGEVGAICRRLDQLPLAPELAAARVKVLSPAQILERLDQRLPLLTGGPRDAPERQRTLRATIAWSHELLTAGEQLVFGRLSVFAGGWTLEAAEKVAGADLDTLESLVDKSLLRFDRDRERFTMLETIREYAAERLEESGEADETGRRHAELFLELAESAHLSAEAEYGRSHDVVIPEQDNLRATIEWAAASERVELGLRIAVALENFWVTNDPFEGMRRFETLLEEGGDVPAILRARALRCYGGSSNMAAPRSGPARIRGEPGPVPRLGRRTGRRGAPAPVGNQRAEPWQARAGPRTAGGEPGGVQDGGIRPRRGPGPRLARVPGARRGRPRPGRRAVRGEPWDGQGFRLHLVAGGHDGSARRCRAETGQLDLAATQAREQLVLAGQVADRQNMVFALAYLASVAAARGDAIRAGRLWGAIEAEAERRSIGVWEGEHELFAGRILARPGPELERGIEEGRRLSLEAAVELALEE